MAETFTNISWALAERARELPGNQALICRRRSGWQSHSFGELDQAVNRLALGLSARGIRRGDRVMLMVTPSFDFICLTFALFRLGAVIILIDPGMGMRNMARSIASVRPEIFIGIPRAYIFQQLFPRAFASVRQNILVRGGPGWLFALHRLYGVADAPFSPAATGADDLAAIIFTTGSTGPPKGVQYSHGVFAAQLRLIREYYRIGPTDIDQPAFPLFALFSVALGVCAVIPDMDASRPADLDPQKFIDSIRQFKVTYSFGSPAIWNVVSAYCLARQIRLPSLRLVLMAGAPVAAELISRVLRILPAEAEVQVPYGATESLPVSSMSGREVVDETWPLTEQGKGTCVGRPLPGNSVRIIAPTEGAIAAWDESLPLAAGEIGEIVVRGPVVTRAYDHNPDETRAAKIGAGGDIWHRMGDMGYLDSLGRLWFCGRKKHRVSTAEGVLYTIPCEVFFNAHPLVKRTALVGIAVAGGQFELPVIIVELRGEVADRQQFFAELRAIADTREMTSQIRHFMIHPAMPVDIRHNAKIFREKLALWAAENLKS